MDKKHRPPGTREEAQALYDANTSCHAVGKLFGWGKDKAFLYLKSLGVNFRKRGGAHKKIPNNPNAARVVMCSEEHLKQFEHLPFPRPCVVKTDENCDACRIRVNITSCLQAPHPLDSNQSVVSGTMTTRRDGTVKKGKPLL